jgi:hypothetical protein
MLEHLKREFCVFWCDDFVQNNESFFFEVRKPVFVVVHIEGFGADARDFALRGTATRHFVSGEGVSYETKVRYGFSFL